MTSSSDNQLHAFRRFVQSTLDEKLYRFDPSKPRIPFLVTSYSADEVMEAIDTMLSTRLVMGEKVKAFEKAFAGYIGVKHAIMVNSGSTANLVATIALTSQMEKGGLETGFEGIVPAVTWPTNMFPINTAGGIPVLCDVNGSTFLADAKNVKSAKGNKTKLAFPVHLLGNPCDIRSVLGVLDEGTRLIEDCCEASGAEISGKKVGSLGDMGSFSFYFSHHINGMEGGMVTTDSDEHAESCRLLRAHGTVGELRKPEEYLRRFPTVNPRFLFVSLGFNFKPTEVQAAFGLQGLKKIERDLDIRRQNVRYLAKRLKRYEDHLKIQTERHGTRHASFRTGFTVSRRAPFSRKHLLDFLERKAIETRPVMGGNLAEQPAVARMPHKVAGSLANAQDIMRNSFIIGNCSLFDREALDYIVETFDEFFRILKR